MLSSRVGVGGVVSAGALASAEDQWLASTFGLGGLRRQITHDDFYDTAKAQYKLARFHLAVRCLEIYIARLATAAQPPAARGPRERAAAPAAPAATLPVGPLHLLAFAHYHCGALARARECFHACVRLGFDPDWQMLVQVELELALADQAASSSAPPTEEQASEGRQALDTLRKHLAKQSTWQREKQEEEQQASSPADAAAPAPEGDSSPPVTLVDMPDAMWRLSSDEFMTADQSDADDSSLPQSPPADLAALDVAFSSAHPFEPIPAVTPSTLSSRASLTAMVTPSSTGATSSSSLAPSMAETS